MKIVHAKAHAWKVTKRFAEYWYAEEPEEIKDGGQEIRNGTVRDKVQQSQFTEDQRRERHRPQRQHQQAPCRQGL